MHRVIRLLVVIVVVSSALLSAQTPRPMTLVDVLNVPRLSDPRLSPDGRIAVDGAAEVKRMLSRRPQRERGGDAGQYDMRESSVVCPIAGPSPR